MKRDKRTKTRTEQEKYRINIEQVKSGHDWARLYKTCRECQYSRKSSVTKLYVAREQSNLVFYAVLVRFKLRV